MYHNQPLSFWINFYTTHKILINSHRSQSGSILRQRTLKFCDVITHNHQKDRYGSRVVGNEKLFAKCTTATYHCGKFAPELPNDRIRRSLVVENSQRQFFSSENSRSPPVGVITSRESLFFAKWLSCACVMMCFVVMPMWVSSPHALEMWKHFCEV